MESESTLRCAAEPVLKDAAKCYAAFVYGGCLPAAWKCYATDAGL
jgi:hypothetical protein